MSSPPQALPTPPTPAVRRWRGTSRPPSGLFGVDAFAPLDAGPLETGDAIFLTPPPTLADRGSPWALVQHLPEPTADCPLVLAPAPKPGFFGRVFGGEKPLPRALRGAALLLRGYVDVTGSIDPATGLDLVWGHPRSERGG